VILLTALIIGVTIIYALQTQSGLLMFGSPPWCPLIPASDWR